MGKYQSLNNLINNLSVGIIITDKNGDIIFVNETISKMTGYTQNELNCLEEWCLKSYSNCPAKKVLDNYY